MTLFEGGAALRPRHAGNREFRWSLLASLLLHAAVIAWAPGLTTFIALPAVPRATVLEVELATQGSIDFSPTPDTTPTGEVALDAVSPPSGPVPAESVEEQPPSTPGMPAMPLVENAAIVPLAQPPLPQPVLIQPIPPAVTDTPAAPVVPQKRSRLSRGGDPTAAVPELPPAQHIVDASAPLSGGPPIAMHLVGSPDALAVWERGSLLRVTVDSRGQVKSVFLSKRSGNPLCDAIVLSYVKQQRYYSDTALSDKEELHFELVAECPGMPTLSQQAAPADVGLVP